VPTNIVEGYSRRGDKELARFLDISLGSLAEVKYLLHFSKSLGYLCDADHIPLAEAAEELGRKLWKFYDTVRADKQGNK
jgi:four helix bundle protein